MYVARSKIGRAGVVDPQRGDPQLIYVLPATQKCKNDTQSVDGGWGLLVDRQSVDPQSVDPQSVDPRVWGMRESKTPDLKSVARESRPPECRPPECGACG